MWWNKLVFSRLSGRIIGRRPGAAALGHLVIRAALPCLVMAAVFLAALFSGLPPAAVYAAKSSVKTVRVGWYKSPFNSTDRFGRRTGYAYEYQRKITAYTGWKYDYIEGDSWPELFEKLERGEIDLLSDVSYTKERARRMLFSDLPMGSEDYYLFVAKENTGIKRNEYASFTGKKIGVDKDSIQVRFYYEWAKEHGVSAELVEMTESVEEALAMLNRGELDAYVTMDINVDPEMAAPICKIGSSDFFFAVSTDRPDLLEELDMAMTRIQDENKYYNQQLFTKYLKNSGTDLYLNDEELAWLSGHGTIRVGYQDNYLAFCASDEDTGKLTGALKEYLSFASDCLENAHLDFDAVAYPTASDAMGAMKKGEVDCMFPANLTDYDSEVMGVVMSPALMRTEMYAVVRETDQKEFLQKEDVTVAVNKGNPNYDMFLMDHYPSWKAEHYADTPACLEAVAAGDADCIIISNYRFNNIAKQCGKLKLTTVSTGVVMDYCFAVKEGDTDLYSVLAKVTGIVPESTANAALTYYSTEDAKYTVADFIREYLPIIMGVVTFVVLIILVLLLWSIRAEQKASKEHHLVADLNKKVFIDALTSVRNKGAYANYIQELQDRLDKEGQLEFAIGVFDCDNLKTINDEFGHDRGDAYLQAASKLICDIFKHSPVFRIGGDEFAIVLLNEDFRNREELIKQFHIAREEIIASHENQWDHVSVAMGIAVYDPEIDHSVIDTVRRADKNMYADKRMRKTERE